jgi:SAM-dependent methyltransferase
MSESHHSPEASQAAADRIARESAHLYSNIVDWYVEKFFDDLEDGDWLRAFRDVLEPNDLVLDAGAGPGNFARYLQSLGLQLISSDIAISMASASHRLVPEAPAMACDMRSIPLYGSTLDAVLCAYSLMHVPAAATPDVIQEFARVTRDGGYLQLMIKTGVGSYQFKSDLVDGGRGFVQLWDPDEIKSLIGTLGFTVLHAEAREPISPYEFEHPKMMLLCQLSKP